MNYTELFYWLTVADNAKSMSTKELIEKMKVDSTFAKVILEEE